MNRPHRKSTGRTRIGTLAAALAVGALALGPTSPAWADSYRGHDRDHWRHRHHARVIEHDHRAPARVVVVQRYRAAPARVVVIRSAPRTVVVERARPARAVRRPMRVVVRPTTTVRTYPAIASAAPFDAASLVGAAIGGLIGAQVGSGNGKLAATAAGTIGGLFIGNRVGHSYR